MRVILFLLFVGFSSYHINAETIIVTEKLAKQFVADTLADFLVNRIIEKGQKQQFETIEEKDARFPLLPFFPISITIPFTDYRLDLNPLAPLLWGFYEHKDSNLHLEFRDDLSVRMNETFITATYKLVADEVIIKGNYSMDINVNFTYLNEIIPDFPIEAMEVPIAGSGGYEFGFKNVSLGLAIQVEFYPNTTVKAVTTSVAELSLGSLKFHFDNLLFNDFEADWLWEFLQDILNSLLIEPVGDLLKPLLEPILPIVDVILWDLLEGCNLKEIIGGDQSCLGVSPGTTELPGPTTARPTPPYVGDNASQLASSVQTIILTIASAAAFLYAKF